MTVEELIEQLQRLNPAAEVRIAYQPHYPLWGVAVGAAEGTADATALSDGFSITCETCGEDGYHDRECTTQDEPIEQHHEEGTAEYVYIATSDSENGYASAELWEAARVG